MYSLGNGNEQGVSELQGEQGQGTPPTPPPGVGLQDEQEISTTTLRYKINTDKA